MRFINSIARSKTFNMIVGIMGLIAIPLLIWNLIMADPVNQIFAFSELVFLLLVFGTFVNLAEGRRTSSK
jgi:phosphoglycerol transferase MdoB-like AlkP superfamily enzyme